MRNQTLLVVAAAVVVAGWGSGRAEAVCGDGVVDIDEDCDLGGTCIGGPNAGTACHVGDATCTGGTCTTFGGQGCAANCTTERDVPVTLVPGELNGLEIVPGTSGTAIISDFLSVPLPLGASCVGGVNIGNPCGSDLDCLGGTCMPSHEVLTLGKEKDGKIPVVVKVMYVFSCPLPVSTLACGCVHGIEAKTCGGALFEPDGVTLSPNCTPGFSSGDPCVGKAPCAFVHGAGNTASGVIGCEGGLDGTDLLVEQDSGGASKVAGPVLMHLTGHGGSGAAALTHTFGISAALGGCTGSDPSVYGPDGVYCTADDPPGGIIAVAATSVEVTGTATAVVHNANGVDGAEVGPVSASGAPFACTDLECDDQSTATGAGLASAFTFVHLDTVGDVAITQQEFFVGDPPQRPECCGLGDATPGDCDGSGDVTVSEIITLVNIALGNADLSACRGGIPCSVDVVDITLIVDAVSYALNGAPAVE